LTYFDRVIQEYSRELEDKVQEEIQDANTQDSSPISSMIRSALKAGHKVYLCTDWHLWRYDKKKKTIYQRSDFQSIINAYNNKVTDDDVVIYLGDLIDGECEPKKKELAAVLDSLKGKRVMIRGNNDLFPDEFYLQHGFKYITPKFVYNDILFTHMPEDHKHRMNIHGHIHGYKTYWLPYHDMIDVAFLNGRKEPVEMNAVIDALPKYRKVAKEVPERFEQEFAFM